VTLPGQITGVHTVGVPVTDQDRGIDFYVGTLGFDKRLDADMGGGRRWIEVAPGGSAITIALVAAHEGVPARVETDIRFTPLTRTRCTPRCGPAVSTRTTCCAGRASRPCSRSATRTATASRFVEQR
jgi:hypothetical protein